jgi:hypothetical protein
MLIPQFSLSTQYYYYYYYWWCGTKSLGTAATSGLLNKPQMIDEDDFWSNWWNEDWQGKPKYSEKTCPSATLSTTKSHMTRPGLEPRTAAVGSQRLTAWAMARAFYSVTEIVLLWPILLKISMIFDWFQEKRVTDYEQLFEGTSLCIFFLPIETI